jgi:phosphoribosylformylglycinamidine synthase
MPGAEHWPRFVRNASEQFEARYVMVEVQHSASILLKGMAGSRMPITTAHGEGRAEFVDVTALQLSGCQRSSSDALYRQQRYMSQKRFRRTRMAHHSVLRQSPNSDGRHTIMMPHPERVFRSVQHSWRPDGWQEEGPWLRLFRNARFWLK